MAAGRNTVQKKTQGRHRAITRPGAPTGTAPAIINTNVAMRGERPAHDGIDPPQQAGAAAPSCPRTGGFMMRKVSTTGAAVRAGRRLRAAKCRTGRKSNRRTTSSRSSRANNSTSGAPLSVQRTTPTGRPRREGAGLGRLVTTRSPSRGTWPSGQCCSRGPGGVVAHHDGPRPAVLQRDRDAAVDVRRQQHTRRAGADLGHPAHEAALVQRHLALARRGLAVPVASSTARA